MRTNKTLAYVAVTAIIALLIAYGTTLIVVNNHSTGDVWNIIGFTVGVFFSAVGVVGLVFFVIYLILEELGSALSRRRYNREMARLNEIDRCWDDGIDVMPRPAEDSEGVERQLGATALKAVEFGKLTDNQFGRTGNPEKGSWSAEGGFEG